MNNQDLDCERAKIPLKNIGHNLFPPMYMKSHWDPTAMLSHILPTEHVSLPLDFRPWTRICKDYRNSAPEEPIPETPSSLTFPNGGRFYPPDRYANTIDKESELRRENRPLDKWCTSKNYIVPKDSNMYRPNITVPDRKLVDQISELAIPSATLRPSEYYCRQQNDIKNFERSNLWFQNTTRQDRYKITPNLQPSRQFNYVPTTTEGYEAPV